MPALPLTAHRLAHVPITARDGCVLSAAVFLPEGEGAWPAIIDAVPYRKDDDFLWLDWDTYGNLASYGFACVRLDLRGTGSSEGVIADEYSVDELNDLEDAIAAVAEMPWCTGRVGMTGVSWGGFNCAQVAMRRPPALAAIAPIHWSHDRYNCDVHYVGGCPQVLQSVSWPGSMIVENALPPDPTIVGPAAFELLWRRRLAETPQWPLNWARRQRRDGYWKHGSLCQDWSSIGCPVFAIGGWLDSYADACLELLEHGSMPRRALIGPWGHARPNHGWPGPPVDHRALLADFFGRALAEHPEPDAEPGLIAFVLAGQPCERFPSTVAGSWQAWSRVPRGARTLDLAELAGPALPASWSGPQWVGAAMPWWGGGSGPPAGYGDEMGADDEGSLCFDVRLSEALTIVGRPRLQATVSADRPVALLAVRLEHVREDGSSWLITRGNLNLTQRAGQEHPEPLTPGTPVDVEIELHATGIALPAGDRLRVTLAGADWPIACPSPTPFELTVHAATLTLPEPDPTDELPVPPLPEPIDRGTPNPVRYRDVAAPTWTDTHEAGLRHIRTTNAWDADLPDGGRSAGSEDVLCEIRDDDPTSCRAVAHHTALTLHGGIEAFARSRLELTCSETHFRVEIDLAVDRGGKRVFEQSWVEDVPRDLM